jgi:hypothetical protein
VIFALSPALASNSLLNYESSVGIKIYGKAISPLDILFDGDAGGLRLFLNKVNQRANQFGWNELCGALTIDSVNAASNIEVANDRNTQNSPQMFIFLIESITDGLLGKVISQKQQYTSAQGFQDGPSLLKVIMTISHVDTRAQAGYTIRQFIHHDTHPRIQLQH